MNRNKVLFFQQTTMARRIWTDGRRSQDQNPNPDSRKAGRASLQGCEFAKCQIGTLGKATFLPSARSGAVDKPFFFPSFPSFSQRVSRSEEKKMKLFAECQIITLDKHISLPSARQLHSANIFLCQVPSFAGRFFQSAECFFASFVECSYFAECFFRSTRQKACLPSARGNTLGNHQDTRQKACLRQ